MKKLLAILMAVMMLTFAFTACAKKDENASEPAQTETTQNTDVVEPEQSTIVESTEMSDFEQLIDTFTNSEDEEAKEKARIELERILEQAEQNAQ